MADVLIKKRQIEPLEITNTDIANDANISTGKLADGSLFIKSDGSVEFTASQSMGGNKLTDVGAPSDQNDAVRLIDLQNAASGIDIHDPVRIATSTNETLSGLQVLSGVTLADGDRVLVKSQTDQKENGLYIAHTSAWVRSTDADEDGELVNGTKVLVQAGDYAGSTFICTSQNPIDIGTDNITWIQDSQSILYSAGAGLTLSGTTFAVGTASSSRIKVNASNIDLATTGVTAGTYTKVTVDAYGRVTVGDNPNTLAGYGILDAYTQTQIGNFFNGTTSMTGYNKTTWDNTADKEITGISFNTGSGLLTLTTSDTTNFTQNLDGRYSLLSHTHALSDLTDTNISGPSLGQLLRYNTSSSAWENWSPNYISENQSITFTATGDVTGSDSGTTALSPTLTIGNKKVTYAKIQDVTASSLLGRYTASNGVVQEITLGTGLSLSATTGVLSAAGTGGTITSISAGAGMDFTTITSTGSIVLGSPSAITLASSNSVSSTTHTHAFVPGGTTSQYIDGTGALKAFPSIPQGTVTSVGVTVPDGFSVTGSPITTSGTVAISFATGYSLPSNADQDNWDDAYSGTIESISFNTSSGVLTLTPLEGNDITTNLDGRYIQGNQTITLSGDVTGSGTTAITTTIENKKVTYGKIQDVTSQSLLGRYAATDGTTQEVTLGTGLSLNSTTGELSATGTGGTVTSVAMSVPDIFTLTGSPITSSGTFAVALDTQVKNTVFSGPATGADSTPTFRVLVSDDIPSLSTSKITSGVFNTARLGSGTASASTYLTGTGWAAIPSIPQGTVTSVALTVPTGLTVTGSPITSSGTLALAYDTGYSIPTTAKQTSWDGKQDALNGTGFVKASGTTITYDNTDYVPTSRVITAGTGLTGGGDLSVDRTLTIDEDYSGFTNYYLKKNTVLVAWAAPDTSLASSLTPVGGQGSTVLDANNLNGASLFYSNQFTTNTPANLGMLFNSIGTTYGLQLFAGSTQAGEDLLYYRSTYNDGTNTSGGTWYQAASKTYVDSQITSLVTPTLQQVTNAGKETSTDVTIGKSTTTQISLGTPATGIEILTGGSGGWSRNVSIVSPDSTATKKIGSYFGSLGTGTTVTYSFWGVDGAGGAAPPSISTALRLYPDGSLWYGTPYVNASPATLFLTLGGSGNKIISSRTAAQTLSDISALYDTSVNLADWDTPASEAKAQFITGNIGVSENQMGLYIPYTTSGYGSEIAFRNDKFRFRTKEAGTWGDWLQVADRDWVTSQGYLSSFTETDPVWTSEKTNYYTKTLSDGRYLATTDTTVRSSPLGTGDADTIMNWFGYVSSAVTNLPISLGGLLLSNGIDAGHPRTQLFISGSGGDLYTRGGSSSSINSTWVGPFATQDYVTSQGYITSYTESDPIWTAAISANTNISGDWVFSGDKLTVPTTVQLPTGASGINLATGGLSGWLGRLSGNGDTVIASNAQQDYASGNWSQSSSAQVSVMIRLNHANGNLELYNAPVGAATASPTTFWGTAKTVATTDQLATDKYISADFNTSGALYPQVSTDTFDADTTSLNKHVFYCNLAFSTNVPTTGPLISFRASSGYGGQMQIQSGNSTYDRDNFQYRSTYSDGKGTWYRVASRQWVTDQDYLTEATAPKGSETWVANEIPSGTVNGTNKIFVLANTPVSGSVTVYLNGVALTPGAGNGYTISGSTITTTVAPIIGEDGTPDVIMCSYFKQ